MGEPVVFIRRLQVHDHIVITGSVVATGETTTGKLADFHRRFTVHTQAFDIACCHGVVIFFFILSKIASVSLLFF